MTGRIRAKPGCPRDDPQTKIQSAPAGAEDRGQQASVGRSAIGMADGRQHDLNADERMRPTAQIDAAPKCATRQGLPMSECSWRAGFAGESFRERGQSNYAREALRTSLSEPGETTASAGGPASRRGQHDE
jgi:hypothetical protein